MAKIEEQQKDMLQGESAPEIKEIRIKKVAELSPVAQAEVQEKLKVIRDSNPNFSYSGYARVSYIETSPLSVYTVDPIEGDIVSVFSKVMAKLKSDSEGGQITH